MDQDVDFLRLHVPALKQYLQDRGITAYIYRKPDLVRLCEIAHELNLEKIDTNNDYVDSYKLRRTLTEDGQSKVACELSEINAWCSNLKSLPSIEQCDVIIYLLKCKWNESRLKNYKQDNGYRLHISGHINDVEIAPIPGSTSFYYVRCTCIPETRQNADPYLTWIIVENTGSIFSGGCSCVADNGTCKHCVALIFALSNYSDRHCDRHTQVGTDVLCVWDKPKKITEPMEIDDIDTRLDISARAPTVATSNSYKPMVSLNQATMRDIEKQLYSVCKNSSALVLQTLNPPSDDEETEECNPPTMYDIAHLLNNSDQMHMALCEKIKASYTPDVIKKIEEMTRGQSDNTHWYNYRKGHITASIFSSVNNFRFSTNKPDNYILKRIMDENKTLQSKALKYGVDHEPVARCIYTERYSKTHKQARVNQCGLFLCSNEPILGASPDGIVSCKCCGNGLLEIKCSYKYQDENPSDVCADESYHLFLDENNKVCLKIDSPWYVQIQGQMGVCNVNWCDFVFFTKKDISIERIYFDSTLFETIVAKSKLFFEKYVVAALLKYTN